MTYIGPQDYLSVDQRTNYISQEMLSDVKAAGITLDEAPIENSGSIGVVEWYQEPLSCAYTKLYQSLHKGETTYAKFLKMAVYSNDATVGPEGLCPMILVFGEITRPARITPSPKQLDRQRKKEDAMKEAEN